jgi:hypothetical protein
VRALASELVRPLSQLRAVILQASAQPDEVAVFLFENGRLRGPAGFSTLGMRIQNEQSGSTSLFAQPMAIEPVPETEIRDQGSEISTPLTPNEETTEAAEALSTGSIPAGSAPKRKPARGMLEARMEEALSALAEASGAPSVTLRQGHLALLKRWYYRPEARRTGEIFFPDAEGHWPVKSILRGVGRVFASRFKAPANGATP